MPHMSTAKDTLQELKQYYDDHREAIIGDYLTFLRFASVSSEPKYLEPLRACWSWLKEYLEDMQLKVEVWETPGHPVLFASYDKAGPDKPTLLVYNHYDVQPVDPLEEWHSSPFEPTIRDGQVYARGAQDNKGQCYYVIQALKALLKRDGKLPLNVKLCIEGEEEVGSSGLAALLKAKQSMLKADYLLIVDVGIPNMQTPTVSLGVRGIVTMEVTCHGSHTDLHSGLHGGLAYNPIHALVEMLSQLRDAKGAVQVPGFYDGIKPISKEELKALDMRFNATEYRQTFGIDATGGEKSLPPLERNWLRPSLEINGIWGGYTGAGFKTVIPASASAKISCRIVPDQDPQQIGKRVCDFLEKMAPPGIRFTSRVYPGVGAAVRVNPLSPVVNMLVQAFQEVFGLPCARILDGASIPITAELQRASGAQTLLVGLGLPTDQIHAPNEHFGLDRIEKGFLIISRALELLATAGKNKEI